MAKEQLETPSFEYVNLKNGVASLLWYAEPMASSFEIAYSQDGENYETVTADGGQNTLTISDLDPESDYYFKIKANGEDDGELGLASSEYSDPVLIQANKETIEEENTDNEKINETTTDLSDNTTDKSQWPDDLQGYSIGRDGFLVVSFDQGETYYEIDTARDVTVNFSTTPVDTSCRRSGMYKENLPIVNELSIDAEMLFDLKDNVCNELVNASQSNGIFLLGAFTDSGNGPLFYGCATDMSRPEELEGVVRLSAKYSLTRFVNWYPGGTNLDEVIEQTATVNNKEYKHPISLIEEDHSKLDGYIPLKVKYDTEANSEYEEIDKRTTSEIFLYQEYLYSADESKRTVNYDILKGLPYHYISKFTYKGISTGDNTITPQRNPGFWYERSWVGDTLWGSYVLIKDNNIVLPYGSESTEVSEYLNNWFKEQNLYTPEQRQKYFDEKQHV